MCGFINSYTTSPKLEAIYHLRSTSTRSSIWQLSFYHAVSIVPLETSQIGLFCFCLSAGDCIRSLCYVYSMIVGRYWLYKLRYLHFSITAMILGYSFSGEYLILSLTPNNLLSVSVLVPRCQSKCPFCSIFRAFWSSCSSAKDCFLPWFTWSSWS